MDNVDIANKSYLKKMLKTLSDEAFIDFADEVNSARQEVQKRLNQRELKKQNILNKIGDIHELIESEKITCNKEQLLSFLMRQEGIITDSVSDKDKRVSVKPKYKYKDKSGEVKVWSGRGAVPPKELAAQIKDDNGNQVDFTKLPTELRKKHLAPWLIKGNGEDA